MACMCDFGKRTSLNGSPPHASAPPAVGLQLSDHAGLDHARERCRQRRGSVERPSATVGDDACDCH